MSKANQKCASCGSTNLLDGKFGATKHTFIPKNRIMMLGYVATAQLCLDCGFLAHYLNDTDLAKIRQTI